MKPLIVFDLDDTLMANVHDYTESELEMVRIIVEALGPRAPRPALLIVLEMEIDKRRRGEINPKTGKPYQYSMDRFPGSLVETYRVVCRKKDVTPKSAVEQRLLQVGRWAFDSKRHSRNVHPHAARVMRFLSDQGHLIAILTKGDPVVQERKLSALKSAGVEWGHAMVVEGNKGPDDFRVVALNISQRAMTYPVWSVGNSFAGDILPALQAGYAGGVFIPMETWETDVESEIRLARDRANCVILSDLREMVSRYEEIFDPEVWDAKNS